MYRLAVLNTHPIQYFAPLYRRLAQEPDIDLTVYFCSRQGSEEYLDMGFGERIKWDTSLLDGYKYKFLKNVRAKDKVDGFWSLINPHIISELREKSYDALWVNGHNHASYLIGIGAARLLRIPVFMRCETHLELHRSSLKRVIRRPLMQILYNQLCDACLPIGTLNRDFYLFHGVKENRLFTVPYTVNNEYFLSAANECNARSQLRQELGLPANRPLILFASKLIARKRPMDLLRAYHRLCDLGVETGIVVVGAGEEETALKDYAKEQRLPHVYFVGFKNQSELPKFYSVADVFVFSSENEPWGLVLNEVMCSGLPVIVSRGVGAAPDLVRHGQNGFVYETGDIEALADYLLSIVATKPELRKQMGQASREIIANWNNERCVDGLKEALASVARNRFPIAERQVA
jgi:glycosyltransferase involved in cell wall biosynthesis